MNANHLQNYAPHIKLDAPKAKSFRKKAGVILSEVNESHKSHPALDGDFSFHPE
jgi:hypothetical protein